MTSKFGQLRSIWKLFLYTLVAPAVFLVILFEFHGQPKPPDWASWLILGSLAATWLVSIPLAFLFWKEERKIMSPAYAVDVVLESTIDEMEPNYLRCLAKKALQLENVKAPGGLRILVTDDEGFQGRDAYHGPTAGDGVLAVRSELDDSPLSAWGFRRSTLGDVVISVDSARSQAAEHGRAVPDELKRLLVHGILHLVGYDHRYPSEEENMQAELEAILQLHGADRASMAGNA